MRKNLFDNDMSEDSEKKKYLSETAGSKTEKEEKSLDRLKNLDGKIADAISKVKALKEEKAGLERKIRELETLLNEKNEEIERLSSEKIAIKSQITDLLDELESVEL